MFIETFIKNKIAFSFIVTAKMLFVITDIVHIFHKTEKLKLYK